MRSKNISTFQQGILNTESRYTFISIALIEVTIMIIIIIIINDENLNHLIAVNISIIFFLFRLFFIKYFSLVS